MNYLIAFLIGTVIAALSVFIVSTILNMVKTYMTLYRQGNAIGEEIANSALMTAQAEYMEYYKSLNPVSSYCKVLDRKDNMIVVNFLNRQDLKLRAMGLKK